MSKTPDLDIFKMAEKVHDNLSSEDKANLQNMDMSQMFQTILPNVLQTLGQSPMPGMENLLNIPSQETSTKDRFVTVDDDEEDDEVEIIKAKVGDLDYTLNVTLEDIYKEKRKKIAFTRKRYDDKGKVYTEKKKLVVPITSKIKDEEVIRYEGAGDHIEGYEPGDVLITISEQPHKVFTRDRENLFMVQNVNLGSFFSIERSFEHIDGTIITMKSKKNDFLHKNNGARKIIGKGLPIEKNSEEETKRFGDLFIRFNLVLPEEISEENIKILKDIFPDADSINKESKETLDLEIITDEDMERLDEEDDDSGSEFTPDIDIDWENDVQVITEKKEEKKDEEKS